MGRRRLRLSGISIAALRQAEVVMMLRIQKERLAGLGARSWRVRCAVSVERGAAGDMRRRLLVMHPGPMIRGLEIAGEVADGPQSAIEEQVAQGLAVRTALLVRALGGEA